MQTLIIILALIIAAYTAVSLAANLSVTLPERSKFFDHKPFNCRPCFTFHLTWMQTTLFAVIAGSKQLLITGIAVAFALFFITRYIDNKKITK